MQRPKEHKLDRKQHGAPMKGLIRDVKVKPGDQVKYSQTLFTVSAMKMEIGVKSKTAGTVKAVLFPAGTIVEAGDLVVLIDPR
ncbi:Biotin-requiring enzyme [Ancylostoma duodenale]|uniref:Biotin-requiring enzyme n=1 Tax=Ancylostoma duodenale TaxID=51022 RepID=A0A0C2H8W5_9BILA|nr:Biotin-requiring enzyme [Ancylostoma duodenale]